MLTKLEQLKTDVTSALRLYSDEIIRSISSIANLTLSDFWDLEQNQISVDCLEHCHSGNFETNARVKYIDIKIDDPKGYIEDSFDITGSFIVANYIDNPMSFEVKISTVKIIG